MDWSRAKTILILSFFLLDLVLGYQLWSSRSNEIAGSEITDGTIEEFDKLLTERNIHVSAEIPPITPTLSTMNVKYKVFTDESFLQNGRNERQVIERLEEGFRAILNTPIPYASQDELAIIMGLEAFYFDQYKLTNASVNGFSWTQQQKDGFPLFDAKLHVFVKDNHIIQFEQRYYESVNEDTEQRKDKVISGFVALRTLVEGGHVPEYETVTDIKLGFHGQQFSSEEQVITPVWRITVQSGQFYDVNAFNGSIEKSK